MSDIIISTVIDPAELDRLFYSNIIALEVVPNLFLSDIIGANLSDLYTTCNIQYRLSLLKDKTTFLTPIETLQASDIIWVGDDEEFTHEHVEEAVGLLREHHLVNNRPTLCHCYAGASRSVGAITAYVWSNFNHEMLLGKFDYPEDLATTIREARGIKRSDYDGSIGDYSLPTKPVWSAVKEYIREH